VSAETDADPAGGKLIPYDHLSSPLTVADIGALQIDASLACLSACETTRTSPALSNEAVHITGAFHLAGYRHVIGTLWPISDEASVEVASDFYRDLTRSGTQPVNTGRAALALHHATRRLRNQTREAPSMWAPYTHTGG
jgi:CHAT domain-containing protein